MTLTEQWKKGELPFGAYYVNRLEEHRIWLYNDRSKTPESQHEIYEILAPVPSYQEYMSLVFYKEDLTKACKMRDKIIKKYEDIDDWWKAENQQLKELLKECKANLIHKKQLLEKLDKLENPTKELLTKIDNAIGEK